MVELCGVTVDYDGHPALADFNLSVAPGERVGLVGPSGAGKTTLLRLCTGSLLAGSGTTTVLGHDLARVSTRTLRDVRRRIGSVRQHLDLVGALQVVHNVNAGRLGSWTRRRALLSLVRPHETERVLAALTKVGIADKLRERTDSLSGGERQRVALARVLNQDPEIILADEPVSSLDPARSEEVLALLSEVAGGRRTLIVSLHDFGLARRWCERLVGIRGGRLVFDCPAREVDDDMARNLYRIDQPPGV